MSAARKIPSEMLPAYFAGMSAAFRADWMCRARGFVRSGDMRSAETAVRFARKYNRNVVAELRRLRAMGAV